jgi:hypothetical protein
MNEIETDITINVYPDPNYHFEVTSSDAIRVTYVERINMEHRFDISFGSLDEMEAVAIAMLKVVALSR